MLGFFFLSLLFFFFFYPKEILKWECKSAAFPPLCAANPVLFHFVPPVCLLLLECRAAEHPEGWLCHIVSWSVINTTSQISSCQILQKHWGLHECYSEKLLSWFWDLSVWSFFIFLLQHKFWLCVLVNKLSQNFKVLTALILTADSYFMNLKLLCLHNKNLLS